MLKNVQYLYSNNLQKQPVNSHNSWLLIANGQPLPAKQLLELAVNRKIMVLDGAYDQVCQYNLSIDILLGDFDSVHLDHFNTSINDAKLIYTPDQQKTDLEKGLHYLLTDLNADEIFLCNALGGRLDHSLFNLRMLKKFYQIKCPIFLFTETETIAYFENTEVHIFGQKQDGFAILGFPDAVMTTRGLKYDVSDYVLDFEKQSGICNALAMDEATIKIMGHALIILTPLLWGN